MIRVVKPAQPPKILRERGSAKRQQHCDDHDAGRTDFKFDPAIYNHKTIKTLLLQIQHNKYCYCESKIRPPSFGDVEHFRPKAGHQQRPGDALGKPGYYWLAYEWSNLFLACQFCNQKFKRNLFPLRRLKQRARAHHDDIGQEQPLLIDPAATDPAQHLAFRAEYAYAVRNSLTGRTTIEVLGLNRPDLEEERRELLTWINQAQEWHAHLTARIDSGDPSPELLELRDKLDAQLRRCVEDSAKYASMARAALADRSRQPGSRGLRKGSV